MKNVARGVVAALVMLLAVSAFADSEHDLRAALKNYRQSLVKKDLATLEKIWTADYTFVNGHGRILTKADRLADIKSGASKVDSITHEEEPAIRIHGNVGIIRSDVTLVGIYSGKQVSGEFRSTHIWINDSGHWHLLFNQLTPVEK